MTFTQCNKKDTVVSANSDVMHISLEVRNCSKVGVNTANGDVKFERYDVIYVVSDGKVVGSLEHNGERFEGTIENASEGQVLYFYFFGNQRPSYIKMGETTACSVVIDDQTSKLPVISTGISNELFSPECSNYSAFLTNRCALVKFNVTTTSEDEPICLSGLNNKVKCRF